MKIVSTLGVAVLGASAYTYADEVTELTGNWSVRTNLAEAGVRPYAVLTDERWVNANGGLRTGAWWNQLLEFGVVFDTKKWGHGKAAHSWRMSIGCRINETIEVSPIIPELSIQ